MLHDLTLYKKTYQFIKWIKPVIDRYPKVHKYSLGLQLQEEALGLLKVIIRANEARDHKARYIEMCIVQHEIVLVLVRLSKDNKLMTIKQYEQASEQLVEIGKMLGGWKKRFM